MQNNYTRFDLIRYYYKEISASEKQEIQQQLGADQRMRHEYEAICRVTEQLDSFAMSPSQSTIELILEHSDHLEHTH